MPPAFTPTHRWVCPRWHWGHGQYTQWAVWPNPNTVYFWNSTTFLYLVNATPLPINVHVDCYTEAGVLVTGVSVTGIIEPRQRRDASLMDAREVAVREPNGDYNDCDEGWFELWATGPVTPAAVYSYFHLSGASKEYVVPVEPAELPTAVAAPPPPYVPGEPAPEGVGAASFEANLAVDQAEEWFAASRSGRPMRRLRDDD